MTAVQETPQIFTLVLLLWALASVMILLMVAYRLIRKRRASALALLSRWGIGMLVYIAISVTVSVTRPARIIEQHQNWCFDDWCIAIEGVHRRPSPSDQEVTVTTDVRIYNAARLPEGAQGFWVYLRDRDDRRYRPTPGQWQDIVVARVPPHEFVRTSIDFVVPGDTHELGFVTGHGGGTPCGFLPSLLEIGQGGCLFHKPNMIRVD
jgi:hypothetical protein